MGLYGLSWFVMVCLKVGYPLTHWFIIVIPYFPILSQILPYVVISSHIFPAFFGGSQDTQPGGSDPARWGAGASLPSAPRGGAAKWHRQRAQAPVGRWSESFPVVHGDLKQKGKSS